MANENKRQKVSQMRITDAEFEMLKSVFADQDELLKTVRNLFLGLEISEDEKKQISDIFGKNETLRRLMRKQFLPEIQADLPIGQAIDLWMTIDLKDKSPLEIYHILQSRRLLIELIEKSLILLENPDSEKVSLSSWIGISEDERLLGVNLIARNTFISHIDQQLQTIKILAGVKTETVDETKKRLLQDSSK